MHTISSILHVSKRRGLKGGATLAMKIENSGAHLKEEASRARETMLRVVSNNTWCALLRPLVKRRHADTYTTLSLAILDFTFAHF